MSVASPSAHPPRRKRRWLRWTLLVLAGVLVALLLALRPIVFFAARYYAERVGRDEKLKISFEPGGNVWSRLSVEKLQLSPLEPGNVRDVRVGRFSATYSLWTLLRSGLRDFVDEIELTDVTIVLDASKPPPPPTSKKEEAGGGIPRFPLPKKVIIRNVNLVLEQAGGQRVELAGFNLELLPEGDGRLAIQKLLLPRIKPLADISAITSYLNRDLKLREANIPKIATFREIAVSLEKLSTGWLVGSASGNALGGTVDTKFSLPASLHLWDQPASGSLSLRGLPVAWPDQVLERPTPPPPALGGVLEQFDLSFGNRSDDKSTIDVRATARVRELRINDASTPLVTVTATAGIKQRSLHGNDPWFAGLVAEATGEVTEPQAGGIAVDRMGFHIRANGEKATVDKLEIVRGGNTVSLTGNAALPADPAKWREGPLDLQLQINAPDLGQLSLAGQAPPLQGRMEGGGSVALRGGIWEGRMDLTARDLRVRELSIQSVDARLAAGQGLAWIDQCNIQIDAENSILLGGYTRLAGDRDFRADIGINLPKLAAFGALLHAAGLNEKLEGALNVAWHANGRLSDPSQLVKSIAGGGTISARGVKVGANGPFDADLDGSLGAAALDLVSISLRSGPLEFRGSAKLADALLQIEGISLRHGTEELAGGHVRVPVDLERMKLADEEKFDINLTTAHPLRLAEIWSAGHLAGRPPLEGTLGFGLAARGSLSKLEAECNVQGRGFRRTELAKLRPADFNLNIRLRDGRVALDGSVNQPQMQALTIRGEVPFDAARLVETGQPDLDARLTASVRLPPSSLGVLIGVVPGLRFIQGTAAADIEVGGTLGKPTFRGSVQADMPAARFENLSIPALRDFRMRIGFGEREVRFEQFQGDVAGGRVNVGGRVEIADLKRATINLAITTKDVLVLRDDNITVRVNSDVKVEGPVAAATVSGRVGLTKSRFLKDVDIVPLRLPGEQRKPAAAPPPPRPRSTGAQIGINTPPLRDWKFNISIVTDDPLRVRGNLANGRIIADLKLTGTGARPLLEGPVTVEQLTARLPFSRLDISYGTIYFTPDQPFNPLLNLNGESQIRDRRVNVTIFGRANDPKTIFTSDPPLAQEQILTLLATGATLDELRGDTGALAGKAAILAAQSLWRKIFKTQEPPPGDEHLRDRFDVDIGATDPRTGKQAVTAQFRITDRVTLVSDFDSEGNFRGQVRYLIRFR